jgi:hypothetical protein
MYFKHGSPREFESRKNEFGYGHEKLVRFEGLYDPSAGARSFPFALLVLSGLRGEHDDGQELVVGKLSNSLEEADPIEVRHVHVADGKVDLPPVEL